VRARAEDRAADERGVLGYAAEERRLAHAEEVDADGVGPRRSRARPVHVHPGGVVRSEAAREHDRAGAGQVDALERAAVERLRLG
jgi:hypothetical protein